MKKWLPILLILLLLSGCAGSGTPSTPPAQETTPAVQPEDTSAPPLEESAPPAETRTVTLYLSDENAEGFDTVEETIDLSASAPPQAIVDALIAHGALPDGVRVNRFVVERDGVETEGGDLPDQPPANGAIAIDLSQEFADALASTGTTGETLLLGSLVNTLLTAYGGETVLITCDGQPPESGHNVYDIPLPFQEDFLGA